jgi:hypothetical protein
MMSARRLELEGTWEEIIRHAPELAGRRVHLTVLPDTPELAEDEPPIPFSARGLLKYAGQWAGNDFEERLREVYATRAQADF